MHIGCLADNNAMIDTRRPDTQMEQRRRCVAFWAVRCVNYLGDDVQQVYDRVYTHWPEEIDDAHVHTQGTHITYTYT